MLSTSTCAQPAKRTAERMPNALKILPAQEIPFQQPTARPGELSPRAITPPDPHRSLTASSENSDGVATGKLVSTSDGPGAVTVLQEVERRDSNLYVVSWLFATGCDNFHIQLLHGRRSGSLKIYVNRVLQVATTPPVHAQAHSHSPHRPTLGAERVCVTPC